MPANQLYHTWSDQIRQLCPTGRKTLIDLTLHNHRQRFGDVIGRAGQSKWLGPGFLTKEHVYRTHLLAHWKRGEKEPWLLATNLSSRQETLRMYRKRMWIEAGIKEGWLFTT